MLPPAVSCLVGRGEASASPWRDSPSAPGTSTWRFGNATSSVAASNAAVRRSRGFRPATSRSFSVTHSLSVGASRRAPTVHAVLIPARKHPQPSNPFLALLTSDAPATPSVTLPTSWCSPPHRTQLIADWQRPVTPPSPRSSKVETGILRVGAGKRPRSLPLQRPHSRSTLHVLAKTLGHVCSPRASARPSQPGLSGERRTSPTPISPRRPSKEHEAPGVFPPRANFGGSARKRRLSHSCANHDA